MSEPWGPPYSLPPVAQPWGPPYAASPPPNTSYSSPWISGPAFALADGPFGRPYMGELSGPSYPTAQSTITGGQSGRGGRTLFVEISPSIMAPVLGSVGTPISIGFLRDTATGEFGAKVCSRPFWTLAEQGVGIFVGSAGIDSAELPTGWVSTGLEIKAEAGVALMGVGEKVGVSGSATASEASSARGKVTFDVDASPQGAVVFGLGAYAGVSIGACVTINVSDLLRLDAPLTPRKIFLP